MTLNEKRPKERKNGRRWPLKMWRDVAPLYQYETDPTRRQEAIITRIDDSGFNYLVVVVAAVGFFTDSYDIFAINIVLPIVKLVYFHNDLSRGMSTALGCSLLIGTAIGQVLFGVLADNYGRRKMYGMELMMLIVATLGLTMASSGISTSMDISAWLIFWRITMGVAIGGDYPLSAVIGAEFAPRKHRARMLAWIFFMQPIGQLLGNLVALAALHANRHYIVGARINPTTNTCSDECIRSLDQTWRWIVGIGIIPAVVALYFRITIPESPRYTLEVARDYRKAYQEALHQSRHSSVPTEAQQEPYWAELKKYLFIEGNWKTLFGTSMSWLILDCAFYGLGANNSKIVSKLWSYETHEDPDIYTTLRDLALRSLVIVVAGALVGSIAVIWIIKHVSRKMLQFWGFIILTVLLFTVGWTYLHLIDTKYKGVVIMLYFFCQLFFNLGPNTTTYIIAAEVFPTRLRASGHGFSAAAGKLGSVIATVFTNEVKFAHQHVDDDNSKSLAYVLFM
ncbi:hypothetical protein ABW20_dc0110298 [Dactylellina cionopaga]|nr:hypothetical protein ABW20_dc0110298 [Dactylellina cionopaga]